MVHPRIMMMIYERDVMLAKRQSPDPRPLDPTSSDPPPDPTPPPTSPGPTSLPSTSLPPSTSSSSSSHPSGGGGGGGSSISTSNGGGGPSSPAPGPSSQAPASTPLPGSGSLSSVQVSTVISTTTTNASGQVIATVYTTNTIVPTMITASSSSSKTGPIVGGVVGGVVGIAALGLLIWLLFAKRARSSQRRFDGDMFDPNQGLERPGRLRADEELDLAGAEPTPYQLPISGPDGGDITADHGMRQHAGIAPSVHAAGAALGAATPYNHNPSNATSSNRHSATYTHSTDPSAPYSPTTASGLGYEASSTETSAASSRPIFPTPFPAGAPTAPAPNRLYYPRSAKEREAMGGRLGVTNPAYGPGGPSGVPPPPSSNGGSSGVVVHQDGGRFREDDALSANEIPPTYDSIRDSDDGPR